MPIPCRNAFILGDNMEEIWKDIKDYEGLYQVSNKGRVKSLSHLVKANKNGDTRFTESKIKNQIVGWHGYCWVSLCKNSKSKTFSVHRLVAKAFTNNNCNLPSVNHIDGDKTNNHVDNLEWCTNAYNSSHAMNNGLIKTAKKVRCIETGVIYVSSGKAEKETGISGRGIRAVCNGDHKRAGGLRWEWA